MGDEQNAVVEVARRDDILRRLDEKIAWYDADSPERRLFSHARAYIAALPTTSDQKPFAYFVEHKGAEPAFIRPPCYVPSGEHYRVTPVYARPAPSDQEKLPGRDEAIKEVVGLCNLIPGSTQWNAAEFMYDLLTRARQIGDKA